MSAALLASVDLILRGGVAMLLLLVAASLARDYGRTTAGRLGAFFAVGTAAYAICSAAGVHHMLGPWAAPIMGVSTGNNVAFWLFARALFDDRFRLRPHHAAIWAAMAGLGLMDALDLAPGGQTGAMALGAVLNAGSLAFGVLAAAQTIVSWRDDLVERRRRLRVFIVAASAGFMVLAALTNAFIARSSVSPPVSLAQAIGLFIIAGGIGWSLLRVNGDGGLFAAARTGDAAPESVQALSPADLVAVRALEKALDDDRIYRQDGLTIGALADRLGLTEHRLRRLINQALGQRNFNVFLNRFRIADAKAALADPSQDGVSILTIALDAGFASLGPFNRAFKAETGLTPTVYRRARGVAGFEFGGPGSESARGFAKSA